MGGNEWRGGPGDESVCNGLGAVRVYHQAEAHPGSHVGDGHGWDGHGRWDRGIESAVGGLLWEPGEQRIGSDGDNNGFSDVHCKRCWRK